MYYLLLGSIIGLIFAIYTSSKWDDTPKHVWPSWLEFVYTFVAIILIIMIRNPKTEYKNIVSSIIVCCGVYHCYIGIQKIYYGL